MVVHQKEFSFVPQLLQFGDHCPGHSTLSRQVFSLAGRERVHVQQLHFHGIAQLCGVGVNTAVHNSPPLGHNIPSG